jgi:small subunit ribosomal protein S4
LSVDGEKLRGEIMSIPTREEIAPIVNEQLIVELYSR